VDAIVSCDQLPSLHNRARVMGCLYVLEGSTLGGQAIKRLLMDRFGTSVAEALAFFGSYGSEVGALWRGFLGCLETSGQQGDADDAANAATETFHMLESWLHQREVLS
jgi:heme oxygenase